MANTISSKRKRKQLMRPSLSLAAVVAAAVITASLGVANAANQTSCGGSLICYNGGLCEQGETSWPGSDNDDGGFPAELDKTSKEGYFCDCLPDEPGENGERGERYTGLSCEIPYKECQYPNGFTVCYHGGSCLTAPPAKWDPGTPVCNCDTAKHKGEVYVGRNCEVLAHAADPCEGQESYCLNGGICKEPEYATDSYCSCPHGFAGPKCEDTLKDENAVCDLKCLHGGSCKFVAEAGAVREDSDAPWGSRDFMFCECPEGRAGIECEHIADVCGQNELVCLHGSTCKAKASTFTGGYECECAGDYHGGVCKNNNRITHCNPSIALEFALGMAVPAFCANGGICTEKVVDGMLMPACICRAAYGGPHCEHVVNQEGPQLADPPRMNPSEEESDNSSGHVGINLVLLTFFIIGLGFMVRQSFRIIKKHRQRDQVVLNLQSFREENQGAVSANGSMLFPSNTPQRTGRFTMNELMHDVEIS